MFMLLCLFASPAPLAQLLSSIFVDLFTVMVECCCCCSNVCVFNCCSVCLCKLSFIVRFPLESTSSVYDDAHIVSFLLLLFSLLLFGLLLFSVAEQRRKHEEEEEEERKKKLQMKHTIDIFGMSQLMCVCRWKRKCLYLYTKLTATISGASDTKPHSLRRRTLPLFPLPMLQTLMNARGKRKKKRKKTETKRERVEEKEQYTIN